jgi:hypothetical protein
MEIVMSIIIPNKLLKLIQMGDTEKLSYYLDIQDDNCNNYAIEVYVLLYTISQLIEKSDISKMLQQKINIIFDHNC